MPSVSLHSNDSDAQKKSYYFKCTGIITSLNSNHATINKSIAFEINTLSIPSEMRIGSRVEYLGYKDEATENIKIVKIDRTSETENSEKCEKSLKSKRFLQKTIRELRQLEEDKLFQYIERLHNLLNRNERKLKKYKAKTKKLQKQVDDFQNSPTIIQNQIKSTDQSRLLERRSAL
ncbi:hypothetical protein GQX74_002083 [Glossina fuscipes]|nr:hypothetical protein GQX74_002083 [Glossina fuscipes]